MTISTITSRVTYVANGSITEFAIPFPFYQADDIEVVERLIATGAETLKEAGTEYSVSGGNGATGTVTAATAPPSTVQWVIRRATPLTQEIDYVENDPFPAATHEEGLDRAAMRIIDMAEQVARAPKFPVTDPSSSVGDYPNSVERASKALTFDSAGKPAAIAFGDLAATFDIAISPGDADKPVVVKTDETGVKVMDDASATRTALGLGDAATKTVGTAAGNVVALDGSAKLPAVDGSQLTNLPTPDTGFALPLNLRVSVAPSAKTCTWAVDEITVETALGGTVYRGASKTFAFDGTTTGANGMDSGAMPTSGDLYIYAIHNPTTDTWACLGTIAGSGAEVYGGANMPSGYTASALIFAGKTNGSGNFVAFWQIGRSVAIAACEVLNITSSVPTTYTEVSLSGCVPVNAKFFSGIFGPGVNTNCAMAIAADTSGLGAQLTNVNAVATLFDGFYGATTSFNDVMIKTAQKTYYKSVNSAFSARIVTTGYMF